MWCSCQPLSYEVKVQKFLHYSYVLVYTVFNQRTWACSSWRLGSNPDYSSFTSYQWCLNKNLSPWGKKAFFWDNSKEKHISTTSYQWISIFIIIYKCIIITANNNDITFISWLVNSFSKDQQEDFWMILYCSSWTVILYEHWQVMEDWKCPSFLPLLPTISASGMSPRVCRRLPSCDMSLCSRVRFYFPVHEEITLIW